MPSLLTAGESMFCPSSTASSPSSSIGTWTVGKDVDSGESRDRPLLSTGRGERKGSLLSSVPVQGMTASSLLSKHAKRDERFDTNPPVRPKEQATS